MDEPLLVVEDLRKTFRTSRWPAAPLETTAIDGVTLQVAVGEAVGIAGESGSGKSTLIGAMCGLVIPDAGSVRLDGEELYRKGSFDRRAWKRVQLIFQDPYTCLNPAMTLQDNVAEPLRHWEGKALPQAREAAREILDLVGLGEGTWARLPRSLSGGQLQRAAIARALVVSPEVLLLDESVSALDVSIQAQVLELLLRLRRERRLTYLFVSHDLSVLRLVCDRIIVMQHGSIVEECLAADLTVDRVTHPYTRQLLEAIPSLVSRS